MIFLIIILVIILIFAIYLIWTFISDNKEITRRLSLPYPVYKEKKPVIPEKYNDERDKILFPFYELPVKEELYSYYNSLIVEITSRLRICNSLHKEDAEKLRAELKSYTKKQNDLRAEIDNFKIHCYGDEKSKTLYKIKELYGINKDDTYRGKILGTNYPGINTDKGNIVFIKKYVAFASEKLDYFKLYKYSELELSKEITYITRRIHSQKEEVVERRWRYQRLDGGPDLRYRDNYFIYTIKKVKVYAKEEKEFSFLLDSNDEYLKLRKLFTLMKDEEAGVKPVDYKKTYKDEYVLHNKYGVGIVKGFDDDKLVVYFDSIKRSMIFSKNYKAYKRITTEEYNEYIKSVEAKAKENNETVAKPVVKDNKITKKEIPAEACKSTSRQINKAEGNLTVKKNEAVPNVYMVDKKPQNTTISSNDKKGNSNLNKSLAPKANDNEKINDKANPSVLAIEQKKIKEKAAASAKYIGRFAKHDMFGIGKIIDCVNELLTIDFGNYGQKKIKLGFSKLVVLDSDFIAPTPKDPAEPSIELMENDLVYIADYGRAVFLGYDDKYSNYRLANKKIISFKNEVLKSNRLRKIENPIIIAPVQDKYIYNEYIGYLRVLSVNELGLDAMLIGDNTIKHIDVDDYIYYEELSQENQSILASIEPNIVIKAEDKYYLVLRFNKMKIVANELYTQNEIDISLSNIRLAEKDEVREILEDYSYRLTFEQLIALSFNKNYYFRAELKEAINKLLNNCSNNNHKWYDAKELLVLDDEIESVNNIYISSKYRSLEEEVLIQSLKREMYYYNYDLEGKSYDSALERLCNKKLLFKIDDSKYFTYRKMGNNNLTISDIEAFKRDLISYIISNKFLTVGSVRGAIQSNVYDLLIDDEMIDSFIGLCPELKTYKIGNKKTIVIKTGLKKLDYMSKAVIEYFERNSLTSIDIYDLAYDINEKFGFEFEPEGLLDEIMDTKTTLFYSEEMEKLYIDKKYYYSEVYGDDFKRG